MAIERTYAMIKPDAVKAKNIGNIISMIEEKGFNIVHLRLFKFTDKSVGQFYAEHVGKDFFAGLAEFMTSDKSVGLVLEKDNAIADWRALMGATNPANADEGTVRKAFGGELPFNAVHGSDSTESAKREITFLFGEFASIPSTEKDSAQEY